MVDDFMRDGPVSASLDAAAPAPAGLADTWITELDPESDGTFFASWLSRQCAAIAGTRAGLIFRATMEGLRPAAAWPGERPSPVELSRIAERAANATRPVIAWARRPDGTGLNLMIGVGTRQQGALAAVIAVLIDVPGGIDSVDPDAFAEQLVMGCGWLDARLSRRQAREATARIERASVAMDIVAVASVERRPARAAAAVVNELAIRLRCDRVSLGLTHRKGIKVKALSHAATFQERGRIVDAIGNAMEECLAQAAPIAFPALPMTRTRIAVAHRDLAMLNPAHSATASVVLPGPDGPAGVLTFERSTDAPFDEATLLLAEAAGALLGPVLRIQSRNDRIVAGRVVDSTHAAALAVLGPEKPSLKLAAIGVLLAVAVLGFARGEYRVTARSVLEGEVQRAAVAPFDGYIAASPVRPGDRLHAGDVLATMDDRDLVLDRARAWADVEKARQKYDEAVAKHDRPGAAGLAAQIEQGEAQLALADDKLRRARIVSPIDGLLVSGDLSQLLGTPVERGKTLFEIAPLNQYRVVLRTDERDLRFIATGQHGQLALSGMPADHKGFTITRVTPIAEAKDGRRVEATLDDPPGPDLRPGMEGIAKVETGPHHLIWAWTHGFIDWLRLTAWKWMP
jgi:multidrug efflux pump subunit AcrA (membrane-fusion protein)